MEKPDDDRARLLSKQKGASSSPLFGRSFTMHSQPSDDYLPHHPTLERAGSIRNLYSSFSSLRGKVNKLRSLFDTPKSPLPDHDLPHPPSVSLPVSKLWLAKSIGPGFDGYSSIRLPGTEDRIVLYFTSLHGIRRTFEDCYAVRMIFRGFRVWVDERDVSMDLEYKKELQSVLGERKVTLPQVFIGCRYVGGSDEVTRLYETGELAKLIDRFPRMAPGFVCKGCGDVRFVPCANCSGSRKVFDDDDGELRRCLECNENGLVRCPECCS
ncbi:hypothetical protein MLD38_018816 [Melastoma candidum]|uniref:Uncharacterized protein n=1 Tax=Melastoma candidum TaxID=119954 RepID=A0ACB9QW21_9MYRT|nr:hypothetical protein MLD38_018816 [Melastoma candidum]